MPYKISYIHNKFKYTAIIPRNRLAYTIIKSLVFLKLNLSDLQNIVKISNLNPMMIVSETQFNQMVKLKTGLDMIYNSIQLHDNSRIYYHTNWCVRQNSWLLMTEQLSKLSIEVTTIKGMSSQITTKYKQPT